MSEFQDRDTMCVTWNLFFSPGFHKFQCTSHVSDGFLTHSSETKRLLALLFFAFKVMHQIVIITNIIYHFLSIFELMSYLHEECKGILEYES